MISQQDVAAALMGMGMTLPAPNNNGNITAPIATSNGENQVRIIEVI